MSDFLDAVLTPLYYVVSAPLLAWREIFGDVLGADPGWAWALAIVGLAVTVRVLMMPLHLQQRRARRDIRTLDPQIRALKETYAHDPERLMQEQMKLVRAVGAKPFLSLLPLLLLGLVMVALFKIIDGSTKYARGDSSFGRGLITGAEAPSLAQAKVGGARIADTFLDGSHSQTQVVALALVVVMCVMHVVAQRQEEAQVPTALAPPGPIEQKQSYLLPVLLAGIAAVSLVLPLGVLIFWTTSKLWTVGQQRVLPDTPGSG